MSWVRQHRPTFWTPDVKRVVSVSAVVILTLVVFTWSYRGKTQEAEQAAQRARAGELTAQAQVSITLGDADGALFMARASLEIDRGSRLALGSVHAAADAEQTVVTLRGHQSGVLTAAFSVDGRRVVTASYDNTARVWDVRRTLMTADELLSDVAEWLGRLGRQAYRSECDLNFPPGSVHRPTECAAADTPLPAVAASSASTASQGRTRSGSVE